MATSKPLLPAPLGVLLARLVVPLWVLTGALFKTFHATPKNLPPTIIKSAHAAGIDLFVLLWALVAIELVAVGVMLFVPRLARATAVMISGVFCLVLIAELASGNFTSCGCLGDIPVPPWAMLLIDSAMLAGLLLAGPAPAATTRTAPRAAIAGAWSVVWVVASGMIVLGERGRGAPPDDPDAAATAATQQQEEPIPVGARVAERVPAYYVADCDTWAGQRWADLELARYMRTWPDDVEAGRRYVIFFSRSCEHCVELLDLHFAVPPPAPTTIVAIPETKQGFEPAAAFSYLAVDCDELELPTGCDWIMTPPIVVALEDGVVRCAVESEDPMMPECLLWHRQ